jgi:hypothetical protein
MREVIRIIAYGFRSKLSFDQIADRLMKGQRQWRWGERDNDNWGRYFSARVCADHAIVKVFEEGDGKFAVNIKYESDADGAEADWNSLHEQVLKELLPSLGAYDTVKVPDYD